MNNILKYGGLALVALVILGLVFLMAIMGMYNSLVNNQESVKQAWAQVESQYQRRFDLIPNYVETVKGYAKHEKSTFEQIALLRSKVGQTNLELEDTVEINQYMQNQGELSSAMSRLLLVMENYPELKANENFAKLQDELSGTENRIATERMRYNEVATKYNKQIRNIPYNMMANMFGFERMPLFESEEEASKAPKVTF